MRILRADGLKPAPLVPHEVSETAGVCIKGVQKEGEIAVEKPFVLLGLFQEQAPCFGGNDKRARIIVGAVAVGAFGYAVLAVLQQTCVIGHREQVIQLQLRQLLTERSALQQLRGGAVGSRVATAFLLDLGEYLQIAAGDLFPDRLAREILGAFAKEMALGIVP
jgi:hypothetical protein